MQNLRFRGGLGQQAGDPQNQGVNPDLPDASASIRVGVRQMHGYPGGVWPHATQKAPAGTHPRTGRAHDLHDLGQFRGLTENCRAPEAPAFQSCTFINGKERGADDSGNPQSEFNKKLVMMVIKNEHHCLYSDLHVHFAAMN